MGTRRYADDRLPERGPPARGPAPLADLRFRRLLSAAEWEALPPAVRARFSKRLGPGASANYDGQALDCRMNLAGRLLAQACRLFGAPLPLESGGGGAAVVSVTEDSASGGQVWTRVYARRRGFPQAIHSAKRFAGPTGLEEYLGRGLGVALRVAAVPGGICFASDHYFVALGGRRWRIPRWLEPGRLTVEHRDIARGQFTFTLALRHPLLGLLLRQHCLFRDRPSR